MRGFLYRALLLTLTCWSGGCRKYLDKVPDTLLTVPKDLKGLRAILDNDLLTQTVSPGLGQLSCDDYYLLNSTWSSAAPLGRNAYTWADNLYEGQSVDDWNKPYKAIYYCNIVLDHLDKVTNDDPEEYDAIKGGALFGRAYHTYSLEETFGALYRPPSAEHDQGVVLRLDPNPTEKDGRSATVLVYAQILRDLRQAVPLLPLSVQRDHLNRPCRPAAFALLARVCLTMQDYVQAGNYADSCLQLYAALLRYDTVNAAPSRPFDPSKNDEILFLCSMQNYPQQYASSTGIDTTLYNSYEPGDLRKTLFFRTNASLGLHVFRGQYTGTSYLFSGLSTDEVWLIRAECAARNGDKEGALDALNTLLASRWNGSFTEYSAATADEALGLVLKERRKELLFRDIRWADLRRLNQDERFAIMLTRKLDKTYTLQPGDARYAFPIPDDEIRLSGIQQNAR